MKRIVILFLCFLLLFLPACSSGEDAGIVGSWKITKCVVNGETLKDINECIFYFNDDGTGRKVVLGEEEFSFSYSFDGVSCVLYNIVYSDGEQDDGVFGEMTVAGNKMTISAYENGSSEIVTLKRQK